MKQSFHVLVAHHKHQGNKYFSTVGNSTNEATCTNHVTHYDVICITAIQAAIPKLLGNASDYF